jgi:hypothetical protein
MFDRRFHIGESIPPADARASIDSFHAGIDGSDDNAADALRYLGATKSRAITQRKLRGL